MSRPAFDPATYDAQLAEKKARLVSPKLYPRGWPRNPIFVKSIIYLFLT